MFKLFLLKSYFCFYSLPEIETIRPFVYMCTCVHTAQWWSGFISRERDMESVMLKEKEEALDGTKWKNDIQNHSGDLRWWEKPKEKKKDNPVPMWAHMQQFRVCELFHNRLTCAVNISWETLSVDFLNTTSWQNSKQWNTWNLLNET